MAEWGKWKCVHVDLGSNFSPIHRWVKVRLIICKREWQTGGLYCTTAQVMLRLSPSFSPPHALQISHFFIQDPTFHLTSSVHEWIVCLRLSLCLYTDMCVCVPPSGEASKSSSPLRTLSTCQNQVELFSPISLMSLAPSWGYHAGELCREGSLERANKHVHMPPLAHSVPSNLHAIMRFFVVWHCKIIFLMYERAWLLVSRTLFSLLFLLWRVSFLLL